MNRQLGWSAFLVSMLTGMAAAQTNKPTVLILGDSISMGYTPIVRELLADQAAVVRPTVDGKDENCEGTLKGVANLNRWLRDAGQPQVIVFNFGLHDLKHVDPTNGRNSNDPSNPRQSEPDRYRSQLEEIVERLEKTDAHLLFATTTPVPPGGVKPFRSVGDPLVYNAIAHQVLEPRGIQIIDFYALAAKNQKKWQQPVNVHFNAQGYRGLAEAVVAAVRPLLGQPHQRYDPMPWQPNPDLVSRLSSQQDVNYESRVPEYELPSILKTADGTPLAYSNWPGFRQTMLELFRNNVYGKVPEVSPPLTVKFTAGDLDEGLCAGKVAAREIRVSAIADHGDSESAQFSFPMLLYLPAHRPKPSPVFVLIDNRRRPDLVGQTTEPDGFLPVELITQRGFAVAVFFTSDVEPDRKDSRDQGIRGFFDRMGAVSEPNSSDWGALSAWAWGASRVLDYLQTDPAVDAHRVVVIGHSRGGKTALWAAAQDTRFAGAISNESGCAGAALSRRCFGERVGRIESVFPYWFCPKFAEFAGKENQLPIDQHQLISLIAPRPVYVASAGDDLWSDPRGEYLALVGAAPAYAIFGLESLNDSKMPPIGTPVRRGRTAYHIRPGGHDLTEGDWIRFIDFFSSGVLTANQ